MRDCPDESLVLRYLGGEAREQAASIESHVDRCAPCRAWLAGLACTSIGLDAATPCAPDGPLALGEHLPVGAEVGRYRIVGVRGQGGMGVVYAAEDPSLHRQVALKVLRTAIAGVGAARLLAEARTMARLSHPHVCPVFDVGAIGDRWFLAMALVEGGTLAQWLAHHRRPREIVAMFGQAGRGLQAAHAVGVVHRDFKPSNVLIDTSAHAVVCDFGLAASEQSTTLPTGGTPRYMAPEQVGGGGDARVDQFAFGVALRDALGDAAIGRPLRAVIARASDPDPAQRYVDMHGLLEALARASAPRARRWLPAVALGGGLAVALAFTLPDAAHPPDEADPNARPEVGQEVQALLDASIERDRASDPRGSVEVLDRAVAIGEASGDRAGLALAWAARGSQLGKIARYTEAIDDLERAFNLATEIDRTDIAADAAIIRVGLLAQELGRSDEALTWGRHVESILGRDETLELRLRADFEQAMGRVHFHRHELDLARARYLAAIELLRPDQPRLERHLASALTLLGTTELERGDLPAARAAMVESIELAESVHGTLHPDVGAALGNLAGVSAELGDFDAAHEQLDRARAIIVAAHGDRHPNVLAIDAGTAALWMRSGKYEQARARLETVLAYAPADLQMTCGLHERLGFTLGRLGHRSEAEARLQRALDCYAAIFGENSQDAAGARLALAELAAPKKSTDQHATGSTAEPPAPRGP